MRGSGFFIGLDLVCDRRTMEPNTSLTSALVEGMVERGVLSGAIGPKMNILKIRPPMVFTEENANTLLGAIDDTLISVQ